MGKTFCACCQTAQVTARLNPSSQFLFCKKQSWSTSTLWPISVSLMWVKHPSETPQYCCGNKSTLLLVQPLSCCKKNQTSILPRPYLFMCLNIQVSSHPYFPEFLTCLMGKTMGKSRRNPLCLMGKTMVSSKFPTSPFRSFSTPNQTKRCWTPIFLRKTFIFSIGDPFLKMCRLRVPAVPAVPAVPGGVGPLMIQPWTLWRDRWDVTFWWIKNHWINKGDSFGVTFMGCFL